MSTLTFPTPRLLSLRIVAMGVVGSLFGLVSLVYLANVPIHGFSERTASATMPSFTGMAQPALKRHQPISNIASAALARDSSDDLDFSRLALHPSRKDYTYTFTGKISCGEQLCKRAEVRVNVETNANRGIERTVPVESDGSYSVRIALQEVPHEQIDWHVLARTPDFEEAEVRGRQILMDEPAVTVDAPIHI